MTRREGEGDESSYVARKFDLAKIAVLHTRIVDHRILEMIRAGKLVTLELDISLGSDGKLYIGHHRLFYRDRGENFPPGNVSLEEAMEVIVQHGVFVKFDCKDGGAIPGILKLIEEYEVAPDKFMLHAYVTEFDFHQGEGESHWEFVNISLAEIVEMRDKVGSPSLQVSCRGFTLEGIEHEDSKQTSNLFKVCEVAQENNITVVNLNLPDNDVPPDWVLMYFHEKGILIEVYEAKIEGRELPCDVFKTVEINRNG